MPTRMRGLFTLLLVAIAIPRATNGFETIRFRDGDQERTCVAKVLVEAQDGGLMLEADDGRIWTVQPKQIVERDSNDQALAPIDSDEMQQRMLDELDQGFHVHRTQHYLVFYNSSEVYAKQVGALFENLYRGFFAFWKNQRWRLPEPRYPLVAVVLRDHKSFLSYAGKDIGKETAQGLIGYFHLASNQMTTFNVPNWERNVATIIHEATHQLAYNCGLQTRFADNPMWVSEGLATFFEAPDLRKPGKWRNIGRVNQVKLADWYRYLRNRPQESLMTLIADDSRYHNGASAAYAEGWALTYFLIKTRRKEYVAYLQRLSEGKPLAELTKKQRLEMFEESFDTTLADLDRQFLAFMRRVR